MSHSTASLFRGPCVNPPLMHNATAGAAGRFRFPISGASRGSCAVRRVRSGFRQPLSEAPRQGLRLALVYAIWSLIVVVMLICGLVQYARAADTVTVTGTCLTAAPCTRFRFTLAQVPTLTPALYLTGFDFDGATEGTLTINGHVLPLFGPEAGPSFDDPGHLGPARTIGFPTDASWWHVGDNDGVITWSTDTANDPRKHEVTGAALQFAPAPEWVGPITYLRRGNPSKLIYGFRNSVTGVRTAFAVEYTGAVHARVKLFVAAFQAGTSSGPLDLSSATRVPVDACDIALLWSQPADGCQ